MNELSVYLMAKHLRVSPRTIAKWIHDGRLTACSGDGMANWLVTLVAFNAFCHEFAFPEMTTEELSSGS